MSDSETPDIVLPPIPPIPQEVDCPKHGIQPRWTMRAENDPNGEGGWEYIVCFRCFADAIAGMIEQSGGYVIYTGPNTTGHRGPVG